MVKLFDCKDLCGPHFKASSVLSSVAPMSCSHCGSVLVSRSSTARGALPFISKDLLASSRWTSSAAGGGPGEGGHQCCCVLVGGGVLANVIPGESTDVKRSLKCAKEPSLWLLLEDRARVCLTHLPLPFTLHHHHQHLAVWPWASSSPV